MTTIEQAAKIIQNGGIVIFPTETVYGIGADATNQEACLAIYAAKGRPAINPLIVHVNSIEEAEKIAEFNNDARTITQFWPGPLTIVLPKKKDAQIASCVTSGLNTIAIRVSSHKILRKLIAKSQAPIAAPSANKSGKLSTTGYEHVYSNFADKIPIIKHQSLSKYGLESTIIDLSTNIPTILRLGFITPENIEHVLGKKVLIASKTSKIKSPGMLLKHYAPSTKLRMNATSLLKNEIGLGFGNMNLDSEGSLNLSVSGDLAEAAANLFNFLHQLDNTARKNNLCTIAVAPIPNDSIGLAINDRLYRASS